MKLFQIANQLKQNHSIIEKMFKPMNVPNQQHLSSILYNNRSDIIAGQILGEAVRHPEYQSSPHTDISCSNNDDSAIIDVLWDMMTHDSSTKLHHNAQSVEDVSDFNPLMELESFQYLLNMSPDNLNQSVSNSRNMLVAPQTNSCRTEPETIDNFILTGSILQASQSIPMNTDVHENQSTTVTPIDYTLNANAPASRNTIQRQTNSVHPTKQLRQLNLSESTKIQIKSQPRSKYRPRTQNESKISSHYLRCEDNAEFDYPTIHIPPTWACQSEKNVIEITLMDIQNEPHPYSIDNKASRKSFENEGLIIKQNALNTLYFRLTNEDFLAGFKTFMVELIKSKQDNVITKKVIRKRKLDQSMLRFTRLYGDARGIYQRDAGSEEYSCIMTENYGDIAIEHVSPQYGPMRGQELMFIVFKGRIVKEDIAIIICVQQTNWSLAVTTFTVNGNVIYFKMPPCPYPHVARVKATVNIYFKQEKFHESTYLYISMLDQNLVGIQSENTTSNSFIPMTLSSLPGNLVAGVSSTPVTSQRASKSKSTKRLNSK